MEEKRVGMEPDMKMPGKRKNKTLGQAMVEFALVLPILLAMLWGIMELARMLQSYLVITNAARFGLRYAVTGDYDQTICDTSSYDDGSPGTAGIDTDSEGNPCDGANYREEIDMARIVGAYELSKSVMNTLRLAAPVSTDGEQAGVVGDPNHFNVTVCSNEGDRIYFWDPDPGNYADRCSTKSDTNVDEDHAGNPETGRHRVLVAVTYEHEFLFPVPFFPEVPTVTLHAERTGVLEQFRPAQVVQLPSGSSGGVPPTATATFTETLTPTDTLSPTVTDTPTITPTIIPLHLNIIVPGGDGTTITDKTQTRFEAEAWDPNPGYCPANTKAACNDPYHGSGAPGITSVSFRLERVSDGFDVVPLRAENAIDYCVFGGSGCPEWNSVAAYLFDAAPNGEYKIYAIAVGPNGSAVDETNFFLDVPTPTPTLTATQTLIPTSTLTPTQTSTVTQTFTPTLTPTITPTFTETVTPTITLTPTNTPAPTCSDINFSGSLAKVDGDDISINVRNDWFGAITLTNTVFTWPASSLYPPAQVNYFRLGGSNYWGGNSSTSPTIRNNTATMPGNSTREWRMDFTGYYPDLIAGDFSLQLTFQFPNGGPTCVINSNNLSIPTPTPTRTPTVTRTPTQTPVPSQTATRTLTPTRTLSPTITNTVLAPTSTNTTIPTNTPTLAPTPTSFDD